MIDNLSQSNQVEWNLSSAIVGEIQRLLSVSTTAYLNGNLVKAFWCLKAVKFRFIQSLTKDMGEEKGERSKLKGIEKSFYESSKKNKRNEMAYYYDIYTETIMDLLEEYGYLIPKKKDSTRIS